MTVARPLLLLASVAAVALLSRPPARHASDPRTPPLLPRPEVLRVVGKPFRHLLADVYWLATIQATGIAKDRWTYRDISHYADLATRLDPDFHYVYVFGAAATTFNLGAEGWVNTEESTLLLERGLERFPRDLFMRLLYAFNLSYYHGRFAEAADVLTETMNIPGAPSYIGPLATRLYAQANQVDAALDLAQTMYEQSTEPEQKELFEKRLLELRIERELRRVDEAIDRFRAREGRAPNDLSELLRARDLDGPPVDPAGGTIYLEEGRALSTSHSQRLEIHR